MTDLRDRLKLEPLKTQLLLIQELADSGDSGLDVLMDFLLDQRSTPVTPAQGKAYQVLFNADHPKTNEFLQTHFPQGLVALTSERGIDYAPLQSLLVKQDLQAADKLTLEKMCELAGETALQRRWLYFTEVERFPITDLQTINTLWLVYCDGKFGFSVQRELWIGVGKNWDQLWEKIGWRKGNSWTRYPNEFTWDLSAPRGHLPLSNQLRGVRVLAALLSHPAWITKAIAPVQAGQP
ncbi:GUN4 N-terminal ARM-like repeat domain-containing protein [Oscillatoria sp. FACHB-1407]|uniref:GUN4 domain-containing protein n=1 Tax=Oscillatoria sp. FACHB-1407 TaxID=2692847 RepID=UPI00168540A4|nr:GUN4 domain-containing protein [Oscillatoria sp. FACHB-1407]MBD2463232.1 GUN4 N-terminal ARM-like repeat domain-containing protein [Oscillatoria sp. FACHB-1407]